jgi:transposase-like protein
MVPVAKSKYSTTDPDRVADAVRRAKAVELRLQGKTFDQIADQLGYHDRSTAYKAVKTAIQAVGREDARELRELDLLRLDRMLEIIWSQVEDGDLAAVDRALRILERRERITGYGAHNVVQINATQTNVSVDTTAATVETLADVFQHVDGSALLEMARLLHAGLPTNRNNGEGGEPTIIEKPTDR